MEHQVKFVEHRVESVRGDIGVDHAQGIARPLGGRCFGPLHPFPLSF